MPQQLTQHKALILSDFGVQLRRVTFAEGKNEPVTYPHQDDYYIIGMVEKGSGSGIIDFKECNFSQGDVFLIQPGQVHRSIGSNDVEGWILFTDSSFVGDAEKNIFDNFLLFASSVKVGIQRMNELKQIASILADRIGRASDKQSKTTARRLTETFVSIVETVQETGLQHIRSSRRQIEIVLAFRHLLTEHLAVNRSPSYYASHLNISPAYLNEVVKEVTGMNASSYIRNETVLQAKRLLVHTTLAVKEISDRLGIDDYAYFSRLFTQAAGVSPSVFRERNLK